MKVISILKVNFQKGGVTMETTVTLVEVYEAIETVKEVLDVVNDNTDDGFFPVEVAETLMTLSDGETGNNDVEILLQDIQESLMYDDENTALYEISSRLELIDARLDTEFNALNEGVSFICTALLVMVVCKFFSWIMNLFSD